MDSGDKGDVELSAIIGPSGRYQKLATALAFYLMCTGGMVGVFAQFLAPEVKIYFAGDARDNNGTVFRSTDCRLDDIYRAQENSTSNPRLIFSSPYTRSSLTGKFQLVCERSWLISLVSSVSMAGAVTGNMLVGQLSEIYGRRRMIILLQFPAALANVCMFSGNYIVFVVSCFFYGASAFAYATVAFLTVMEFVSTVHRPMYGTITSFGISAGQLIIAGLTWVFQDWFYTQLAQTVLVALPILFTWYFLESPVWLTTRGRYEEARKVLETIVTRNGINSAHTDTNIAMWIQRMARQNNSRTARNEGKLSDLFKTPKIRMYTVNLTFILFSVFFIFYGLSMNMEGFGSDLYEDVLICNALAVLSLILCTASLKRISIRKICCACKSFLTVVCVVYPFVHGYPTGRTILAALARFCISPSLNTSFTYAAEVIPTSVRGVGLGFVSMTARLSSVLSPFTKELGLKTARYVPFILFAFLSFVSSSLLVTVMPDTKGRPLANTIADLEDVIIPQCFGKSKRKEEEQGKLDEEKL